MSEEGQYDRLRTTDPEASGWEAVDRMLRAYPPQDHSALCRVASEIEALRRKDRDVEAEVRHWREAAAEVGATDGHSLVLDVDNLKAALDRERDVSFALRAENARLTLEVGVWREKAKHQHECEVKARALNVRCAAWIDQLEGVVDLPTATAAELERASLRMALAEGGGK